MLQNPLVRQRTVKNANSRQEEKPLIMDIMHAYRELRAFDRSAT